MPLDRLQERAFVAGVGVREGVMGERTPRPWAENVMPTPEQLADWLEVATRDERVDFTTRALEDSVRALHCFIANHASLQDEIQHVSRRSARYHAAWLSARRRVHPLNFLREYRRRVAAADLSDAGERVEP